MVKCMHFQYEPEHKSSVAILRGWPKICVCVCVCISHFLCDLLECERSHSETHTDSAWSNSQHSPLCIIRSAYRSSSAVSHIIPHHIIWLFLHAILTPTCPTTAPFPSLRVVASYVNDQCHHNL